MEHVAGKKILIVDDDEAMLRAMDKVLSGAGAKVTTTTFASEAIEFLIREENSMHLVITDLRMPAIDGATMVYAVRMIFPRVPVVVLTAYGSPEVRAECLREGASGFLEKTMSADELIDAIGQVLAKRKSVSEMSGHTPSGGNAGLQPEGVHEQNLQK